VFFASGKKLFAIAEMLNIAAVASVVHAFVFFDLQLLSVYSELWILFIVQFVISYCMRLTAVHGSWRCREDEA